MGTRNMTVRRFVRVASVSAVATFAWTGTVVEMAAAAPAVSAAFVGLQQGSMGADVRSLQQALIAAGIPVTGGADGVFGPATKKAVAAFQQARGLPTTGTVDEATSVALASSTSTTTYGALGQGSQGDAVKTVQQKLISFGVYLARGADGVWDAGTTRGVQQFQRWNGLTVTGTLNAATLKKLGLTGSTGGQTGGPTAPPVGTPSTSYVGLKRGATGTLVKDLQRALTNAGLVVPGGADGVFGAATETTLKSFQRANGLTQNGVVDERVVSLLKLGAATPPAPTPPPSTGPSAAYVGLKVGSSGPLVKELQWALMGTGLTIRGGADGSFGPATDTALKAMQKVNGMSQTGVVTEQIAKLLGLGTGTVKPIVTPPPPTGAIKLDRFPVQGQCWFGDTWHAPRSGGRLHEGVDVIAAEGKLLYAVVDGTISKIYWDQPGSLAGNGLRIQQPNGTYFTYLHMLGFVPGLTVGTKVKAGDVIGFVGSTGSSATPHLHFEIHPYGGAAVNPYPFVKAMNDCANTTPRYQGTFT